MIEVYAFYFPQLYVTKENSEWWGEGFTDWDLVRKAKPIFKNHNQPRSPLLGYHDQSNCDVLLSQVEMAVDYNISGFNFYHYWFDSKPYLDIPVKNFIANKDVNLKFMLTWANESWTRQWVGKPSEYLIEQTYYSSISKIHEHYRYLSQFFLDERYRKINNRPVMVIYRPELIPDLSSVLSIIDRLAIADGFDGMYFIACRSYELVNRKKIYSSFQGIINFNPRYMVNRYLRSVGSASVDKYLRVLPERFQSNLAKIKYFRKKHTLYNYHDLLSSLKLIESFQGDIPVYQSVFPDWDNTARYSERATLFSNTSLKSFSEMIDVSINQLTEKHMNFLFVNAWNEWSEGAYLEPDTVNEYGYLEVIKNALYKCNIS